MIAELRIRRHLRRSLPRLRWLHHRGCDNRNVLALIAAESFFRPAPLRLLEYLWWALLSLVGADRVRTMSLGLAQVQLRHWRRAGLLDGVRWTPGRQARVCDPELQYRAARAFLAERDLLEEGDPAILTQRYTGHDRRHFPELLLAAWRELERSGGEAEQGPGAWWWFFAACLGVLHLIGFAGSTYDDNFISYRYALNWAEHGVLEYNLGERVLGTSAPGYAIALGTLARLATEPRTAIPFLGSLAHVFSLVVIAFVLLRGVSRTTGRDDRLRGLWILLLLAYWLFNELSLWLSGSETFLVAALICLAADRLFAASPRPWLAGALVAAAISLRLDAGLGAAGLGLVAWWHGRKLPWRYALAGLAPTVLWLAWLEATFGRVVPYTLAGKTALTDVAYGAQQWRWLQMGLGEWTATLLVVAAVSGVLLVVRTRAWRDPVFQVGGLWLVALESAYRLAGVWFAPWYHVSLLLALTTLAVQGLSPAAIGSWLPKRRLAVASSLTIVASLALVASALPSAIRLWGGPTDPRQRLYGGAAAAIQAARPEPGDRVLAAEIGVLGYSLPLPILDYGGLVSPDFAAAKFAGKRNELATRLGPEWVVISPGPLMSTTRTALGPGYSEIARLEVPEDRQRAVLVLRRHAARAAASDFPRPGGQGEAALSPPP